MTPLTSITRDIQGAIKSDLSKADLEMKKVVQDDYSNLLLSVKDYGIGKLDPATLKNIADLRAKQTHQNLSDNAKRGILRDDTRLILLKNKGMPLLKDVMPFSEGAAYCGDSGGPLIDDKNNIVGVFVRFYRSIMANKLIIVSSPPEMNDNCVADRNSKRLPFENNTYLTSLFVHKTQGVIICVNKMERVKHKTNIFEVDEDGKHKYFELQTLKSEEEGRIQRYFQTHFTNELRDCFTTGGTNSNFFQARLKTERDLSEDKRWFTTLCNQFRPWNYDFFVSTYALKDWIGRATVAAFSFIENEQAKKNQGNDSPSLASSNRTAH